MNVISNGIHTLYIISHIRYNKLYSCQNPGYVSIKNYWQDIGEQNMNNHGFDYKRVAQGYKSRPFLHRQVIERFQKDVTDKIFTNGLDILRRRSVF